MPSTRNDQTRLIDTPDVRAEQLPPALREALVAYRDGASNARLLGLRLGIHPTAAYARMVRLRELDLIPRPTEDPQPYEVQQP